MTIEEMRAALIGSHDEGVDTAAVYDSVLSEVSGLQAQIEEGKGKLADLTNRVTELTENNLKLLDKIRYTEPEQEATPEDTVDEPEITLANLFEEV